jgi:hypothetical protein
LFAKFKGGDCCYNHKKKEKRKKEEKGPTKNSSSHRAGGSHRSPKPFLFKEQVFSIEGEFERELVCERGASIDRERERDHLLGSKKIGREKRSRGQKRFVAPPFWGHFLLALIEFKYSKSEFSALECGGAATIKTPDSPLKEEKVILLFFWKDLPQNHGELTRGRCYWTAATSTTT